MNNSDMYWVKKFVKRFSKKERLDFWSAVNKYLLPVFSSGENLNDAVSKVTKELYQIWDKDDNIKNNY